MEQNMNVWSAICVYTDSKGLPQLCFNRVFKDKSESIDFVLDSFYREYEDMYGNYTENAPNEKDIRKKLTDWNCLEFDDGGARKFRWFIIQADI